MEKTDFCMELFEGVHMGQDGKFAYDFEHDDISDFIQLTQAKHKRTIKQTDYYYYGYAIKKSPELKLDYGKFLHYIKSDDGLSDPGVIEMIEKCIEKFTEEAELNKYSFNYILQPQSSSKLVSLLCEKLNQYFKSTIVKCEKRPAIEFDFNWEKMKAELNPNVDFEKLKANLTKNFVERTHKAGYFSATKILPQYRKWLIPMFKIDDTIVNVNDCDKILLVDDTVTSGTTLQMLSEALKVLGYKGQVFAFSFISNRN